MSQEHNELTSYCLICERVRSVECLDQYKTNNHYPPIYDHRGRNINPDKNSKISKYKCLVCDSEIEEKITNDKVTINGQEISSEDLIEK